jgi:hypothetical protein
VVGNNLEGGGTSLQNAVACTTQTYYENRTVGYNVTYEFEGRQYTVQTANDPGPSIRLQVSPMGAAAPQGSYPLAGNEGYAPSQAPQGIVSVPGVVASSSVVVPSTVVYPAAYPTYYPAPYYAAPYYPPIGISLGFGFGGGWGGGHHHGHRGGGHWRR